MILKATGDNLTKLVIKEGFAKVKGKIDDLLKLYNEAVKENKGIFNPNIDKTQPPTPSTQKINEQIHDKYKNNPVLGIVEEVLNSTLYKITLIPENKVI